VQAFTLGQTSVVADVHALVLHRERACWQGTGASSDERACAQRCHRGAYAFVRAEAAAGQQLFQPPPVRGFCALEAFGCCCTRPYGALDLGWDDRKPGTC